MTVTAPNADRRFPPDLPPPLERVRWWMFVLPIMLLFASVGTAIRLPYYWIGPGPGRNVLELMHVQGAQTYPSDGELLITTVSVSSRTVSLWEALGVWLDPNLELLPTAAFHPSCLSDEEVDAANRRDMSQSKVDAQLAAFGYLRKTVRVAPGGVVLAVTQGAPAAAALRPGDVVVAVDGATTPSVSSIGERIRARAIGERVRLTYLRGNETRNVTLTTRPSSACDPEPFAAVGVHLGTRYVLPHNVVIDTRDIGGPSGGLVFALAIIDSLLEEDLTRGHVVAVTGRIALDDRGRAIVGGIGAVEDKLKGARHVGADVFIAPTADLEQAKIQATPGLRVIGVSTLSEAVAALRALPAAG